jgi:hypothetical protein
MLIYWLTQYVTIFPHAGAFNRDLVPPMKCIVGGCYICGCKETTDGINDKIMGIKRQGRK